MRKWSGEGSTGNKGRGCDPGPNFFTAHCKAKITKEWFAECKMLDSKPFLHSATHMFSFLACR